MVVGDVEYGCCDDVVGFGEVVEVLDGGRNVCLLVLGFGGGGYFGVRVWLEFEIWI